MTLTQLNYIVAVAKHRHFGAAAESCFVTQPTLSMQVQKLEDELGIKIFDRSSQPINITPLGRRLVEQAQIILSEAEKMKALSAEELDIIAPVIRVGIIPTLSTSLSPKLVDWFSIHHPDTELHLEELQTADLIRKIKDTTIDIGLAVTPLNEPLLAEEVLFYEPFFLYASTGHPFTRAKEIKPEDLRSDDIWLLAEGHCFREQTLKICHDYQSKKANSKASFESGSIETLRKMVDISGGYTLVPALSIDDISETRKKEQLRPFAHPLPTREVSLIYSRIYKRRATLNAVSSAICKNLPDGFLNLNVEKQNRIPIK